MALNKTTFKQRLEAPMGIYGWEISRHLFGDVGCNIYDFEVSNYNYFLDKVKTLEDLIGGLCELSPFADDALDTALGMTEQEFIDFKIALAHERRVTKNDGESVFPQRHDAILIPGHFISSYIVAQKFDAPLGCALIRSMECTEKNETT